MANQIELLLDPALFSESEWVIEYASGTATHAHVNTESPTKMSAWDGRSFRVMPLYCRNHEGVPIAPALRYFDFVCDQRSVKLTAVYKDNHAPHPDPIDWPVIWHLHEPFYVRHFVFTDLGPIMRPLKIDVSIPFFSETEKKLSIKLVG